jgi:hypothetical protein
MLRIWWTYFFRPHTRERNFCTTERVKGARVVVLRNRRLQKILSDAGILGFTVLDTVFIRSKRVYTARLLRHELTHVEQYRKGGVRSLVKYAYYHARVGYNLNPYEVEARAAE